MKFLKALFVITFLFASIAPAQKASNTGLKIDYQKFTLPNGLEVIFHVDPSDPVVAVSITA